jgi:hypothetical protein
MLKVDNARRKVRRKLVAIQKKIAYWRRRAKREELPDLQTKEGSTGRNRLEHFEALAADLRRGAVPRALSRAHGTSQPHL